VSGASLSVVTFQKGQIDLGEIKTKTNLLVDDAANQTLRLSARNMKDSNFLPPEGVNVYDLLRHDHLVVSKDAIKAIEARCLGSLARNGSSSSKEDKKS
jgi:hypothetical protein